MILGAALVAVVLLAFVARRRVAAWRERRRPDPPVAFMEAGGSHLSRDIQRKPRSLRTRRERITCVRPRIRLRSLPASVKVYEEGLNV